jgi:hypothetical protein
MRVGDRCRVLRGCGGVVLVDGGRRCWMMASRGEDRVIEFFRL